MIHMAGTLLFLFLFLFNEAQAQTTNSNISLGSSLSPASKQSWLSPSGQFAFGFFKEKNGFAVGIYLAQIPEKMVVWTAYWDNDSTYTKDQIVPNNATLLLTTDGRLILQGQGQEINIAEIEESIASASMLDNGNFVLYDSKQNIAWQSFDHPTDTLLPGQRLPNNEQLNSRVSETDYSLGFSVLKMQRDGNLVMMSADYNRDAANADPLYAYYATDTYTYGNQVTLNLDEDGRLYLLNSTEFIKNITEGVYLRQRTLNIVRLDVDGILKLYSVSLDNGHMAVVWNSTNDKCAPKGICGLNAFCDTIDQDMSCRCLPGFAFVGANPVFGCARNFTAVSCQATNQSNAYTIRRSEATVWANIPYSKFRANRVEDCEQSCLEDCICDAAMFEDQTCQKQRLPLRFGRRDTQDTNIVLIKVGLQEQTTNFDISLGSSLSPAANQSSWLSPSGQFGFGFYKESNGYAVGIFLTGIPEKMVIWTANWKDDSTAQQEHIVPSNATLLLTTAGRLILQGQGQEINIAEPVESIASAAMLDNGNFVLYNSKRDISWQSFDYPTDTLLPGQRLSNGRGLTSRVSETDHSVGFFVLKMQTDGNLMMYPVNYDVDVAKPTYAYYATDTSKFGNQVTLNLDEDGRLYLLNSTEIIMNITKGGYPRQRTLNIIRLDVDGILKVYSVSLGNGNITAVWHSTTDKCAPKGRCGLNGFCVLSRQDISCRCLPGFGSIGENPTSGCGRNFTAVSCIATNQNNAYIIKRSENTVWDNSPYSVLGANRVEDCEKQCLDDCNCEAAMFKDQSCQKQKLPLRFGRFDIQDTNIALIKVGIQASIREKTEEQHTNVVIVGISLIVLAILIVAIGGLFFYRYPKWTYKKIHETQNAEIVIDVTLRAFSYRELVQITNNFNEELGKGSSGTVYKGILSYCQTVVAVKKIERELAEGEREFQTEMKVIAKTHHKNLVSLLGYCIEGTNRLLVYEFMCNGSLADSAVPVFFEA